MTDDELLEQSKARGKRALLTFEERVRLQRLRSERNAAKRKPHPLRYVVQVDRPCPTCGQMRTVRISKDPR